MPLKKVPPGTIKYDPWAYGLGGGVGAGLPRAPLPGGYAPGQRMSDEFIDLRETGEATRALLNAREKFRNAVEEGDRDAIKKAGAELSRLKAIHGLTGKAIDDSGVSPRDIEAQERGIDKYREDINRPTGSGDLIPEIDAPAVERNLPIPNPTDADPRMIGPDGEPMGLMGQAGTAELRGAGGSDRLSLSDTVNAAADKYGLDRNTFRRIINVESRANPNAASPGGKYHGLLQISKGDFAKYGGGNNIYDPAANAEVGAKMLAEKGGRFQTEFGRQPTATELYMIHQQGEAGARAHFANPDAPAWQNIRQFYGSDAKAQQVIWGNLTAADKARYGNVNNVSSANFINTWGQRVSPTDTPVSAQLASKPGQPMSTYGQPAGPSFRTTNNQQVESRVGFENAVKNLNPEFQARVMAAYRAMPADVQKSFVMNEGWRTRDYQATLYDRYKSGQGGLAAPPGHSRHEAGTAIDIDRGPARDWLRANGARYGITGIKGDDPHFQMVPDHPKKFYTGDASQLLPRPGAAAAAAMTPAERAAAGKAMANLNEGLTPQVQPQQGAPAGSQTVAPPATPTTPQQPVSPVQPPSPTVEPSTTTDTSTPGQTTVTREFSFPKTEATDFAKEHYKPLTPQEMDARNAQLRAELNKSVAPTPDYAAPEGQVSSLMPQGGSGLELPQGGGDTEADYAAPEPTGLELPKAPETAGASPLQTLYGTDPNQVASASLAKPPEPEVPLGGGGFGGGGGGGGSGGGTLGDMLGFGGGEGGGLFGLGGKGGGGGGFKNMVQVPQLPDLGAQIIQTANSQAEPTPQLAHLQLPQRPQPPQVANYFDWLYRRQSGVA